MQALTPDSSLTEVVEEHPFLIDFLAAYNPKFALLKNPIMRNTAGRIATLRKVAEMGGTEIQDLLAAIGPGLGPCCAEFRHYLREFPQDLWKYQVRPGYFDLWQLSFDQLTAAGIKPDNIEVAALCTRCRPTEFFSYRREGVTGRQAAVIALRR